MNLVHLTHTKEGQLKHIYY